MKENFKAGLFGLVAGIAIAFPLVDSVIRAVNLYSEEREKPEPDYDVRSEKEES